jgi:hypothetical protein
MAALEKPFLDCGFEVATEVEDSGATSAEDGEAVLEAGVIEEVLAFVVETEDEGATVVEDFAV